MTLSYMFVTICEVTCACWFWSIKVFSSSSFWHTTFIRWVPVYHITAIFSSFVDLINSIYMSSYTPAEIRKVVDDMDDVIRAAVRNGDIEKVFTQERSTLVFSRYRSTWNVTKTELGLYYVSSTWHERRCQPPARIQDHVLSMGICWGMACG